VVIPRAIRTIASRLLSVELLLLPALVVYGLIVDPVSGHGGIPCIWKLCFGLNCPGCGLSRADALLLQGRLAEATASNWLIIPVWLVALRAFVVTTLTIMKGDVIHA
jgi:Protein of unknown function (DUF2752)